MISGDSGLSVEKSTVPGSGCSLGHVSSAQAVACWADFLRELWALNRRGHLSCLLQRRLWLRLLNLLVLRRALVIAELVLGLGIHAGWLRVGVARVVRGGIGPCTRWLEAAHVFGWKSGRGRRRDQIAHARKKAAAALTQGKFAGQTHGQSALQIRRAPTAVIKLSFSRLLLFFFIIEQRKFSTLTIKHFLWRDPSSTWRCEVSMRTKTVCDVETKHQWLILGAVSSAFEQWERAQ
jgi:hypothetical protein